MHFDDNAEIMNPVIKIIKEYEKIEKAELAHYNFLKKQKKIKKSILKKRKAKQYKLLKITAVYIGLFMIISAFKMNAVYAVMDLNMQLKILDSKITENEKILNNLTLTSKDYQDDLEKVKSESKDLGFTDEKKVTYVYFK